MDYTDLEKAAIIFSLMGPDMSAIFLKKLPKQVVERVQQDVIPLINNVHMPEDIDGFVLDEIIRQPQIESTADVEKTSNNENVETASSTSTTSSMVLIDWDLLSDDELYARSSVETIIQCLLKENKVFQQHLLGFFPFEKQDEVRQVLKARGIQLLSSAQKNPMLEKIEGKLRQSFTTRLRAESKMEMAS